MKVMIRDVKEECRTMTIAEQAMLDIYEGGVYTQAYKDAVYQDLKNRGFVENHWGYNRYISGYILRGAKFRTVGEWREATTLERQAVLYTELYKGRVDNTDICNGPCDRDQCLNKASGILCNHYPSVTKTAKNILRDKEYKMIDE